MYKPGILKSGPYNLDCINLDSIYLDPYKSGSYISGPCKNLDSINLDCRISYMYKKYGIINYDKLKI